MKENSLEIKKIDCLAKGCKKETGKANPKCTTCYGSGLMAA